MNAVPDLDQTFEPVADLENTIRRALADAMLDGADYVQRTERAVKAVLKQRPGCSTHEALLSVNRVRYK